MGQLQLVGHLLLWAGFLAGAFVAVQRTDREDNPWATIHWPAYGAAVLVSVVGVVLLRQSAKRSRVEIADHSANVHQMASALERIRGHISQWRQQQDPQQLLNVHHRIDELVSDDLAAFADARETLIDAFGLDHYAAIMTEFALAERTINRMWSASADGYIDEVNACLTRAAAHLEAVMERLDAARAES